MAARNYRVVNPTVERRTLLRGALLSSAGIAASIACGTSNNNNKAATTATTAATAAGTTGAGTAAAKAATPAGSPAASSASGTLTMPFFEDLHTLDSGYYFGSDGGGMHQAVLEQLIEYQWSADYKPEANGFTFQPRLAKAFEQPDPMTYVFHLPSGVKFHDGTDLTGDAVKFAMDRTVSLKQGASYMFDDVKSVEMPDPLTVRFNLNKLSEPFLHYLACFFTPMKIMSPTAYKAHDNAGDPGATKWAVDNMVGTGPYKLDSHVPGQAYNLSLNPNYWNAKPGAHIAKYIAPVVPDTTQQRLRMEGGEFQALHKNTPPTDIEALKAKGFQVTRFPGASPSQIWMNNAQGLFKDQRAREAIARAVDYDAIEKVILRGYGVRGQSVFPRVMEGYAQGQQPAAQDLAKVKALLTAAGADGQSITVRNAPSTTAFARPILQQLQSDLAKFNLKMDIQEIPQAVLTDLRSKPESTPDLVFTTASPDALSAYTHAYIYYDSKGPLAHAWYEYPEVNALIEGAYSELDAKKRTGMYQQVGQILGQKLPVFTVFELDNAIVHTPKLTNVKVHPGFFFCFDWYSAQLAG